MVASGPGLVLAARLHPRRRGDRPHRRDRRVGAARGVRQPSAGGRGRPRAARPLGSVNVSARQLRRRLVDHVRRRARAARGRPPACCVLEITESAMMADEETAAACCTGCGPRRDPGRRRLRHRLLVTGPPSPVSPCRRSRSTARSCRHRGRRRRRRDRPRRGRHVAAPGASTSSPRGSRPRASAPCSRARVRAGQGWHFGRPCRPRTARSCRASRDCEVVRRDVSLRVEVRHRRPQRVAQSRPASGSHGAGAAGPRRACTRRSPRAPRRSPRSGSSPGRDRRTHPCHGCRGAPRGSRCSR